MKLNPLFKYHKFSSMVLKLLFLLTFSIGFNHITAQNKKPFVVVLDAGHGGKDPGKVGYRGAKEKDVALSIVLKTGKILQGLPNVKVMYTRKSDVFVDLWKRGNIANDADADLFVSVHCNAHTSQAIGAETWVLGLHANERNFRVAKAENEVILQEDNHKERYQGFDPKSPTSVIGLSLEQEEYLDQSLLLASLIQEEFEKKLKRVNRGVKQAGFVVLYQTYMPSVLIETGFLTNKIEGKYLYSKAGQLQMSKAIANSITDYYKRQQLNVADRDFMPNIELNSEKSKEDSHQHEANQQQLFYKVQVASGKSRISTSSYNFKGLKGIERVKVGKYYKYYYGKFHNISDASKALSTVKNKGFKSAFVASFNTNEAKKEANHTSKEIVEEAGTVNSKVYYKVQIASSSKKISTSPSNFKGLQQIDAVKVGNYYKYYLGKTASYTEAKNFLQSAKSKEYKSAFIVAFLNNKRITLKEALKQQTN
ncbi:N-acetylmuramoyl-L-alanine amidase family protein [Wenyingzhuangia sp. IMCC45533]